MGLNRQIQINQNIQILKNKFNIQITIKIQIFNIQIKIFKIFKIQIKYIAYMGRGRSAPPPLWMVMPPPCGVGWWSGGSVLAPAPPVGWWLHFGLIFIVFYIFSLFCLISTKMVAPLWCSYGWTFAKCYKNNRKSMMLMKILQNS